MATESQNLAKGLAFISPWLVGFAAFTVVPIGLSLYYSFCDYSLLQSPVFIGLANYREILHEPVFWKVLGNTLYYAALTLPLTLILAFAFALLLNVKIRGQSIYRTVIFLPSLVPAVASAMLWLWLFNAKLGLINTILYAVGVDEPPTWLASEKWAMPALVFMSLWGVGHTVVIYLAGLQDVPRELYEAADLDGATILDKVFHVTLPSISPVIFFNLIMGIIGTLQVFGAPFIMTGGGPNRATYFFTMYLYDNAFVFLRMGYASALAWVQLLLVLALTAIAFWTSRHWVHYQGK
jgi:multiple sugar transport system permease protein